MRWLCLVCGFLFVPKLVLGQLDQLAGLGGLPEVERSALSQQDDNPLGKIALALHPADWKHAEGEHFIYHFVRSFVASRAAVEAEFDYRVATKELEQPELAAERKSHLYIFDRPEDWREFQRAGVLEPWTGGIHSAGSLFLLRDPSYKFSGPTLAHEITHLIVYRLYGSHVPCWLNEGLAEYVARTSHASYQRARGFLAKPSSASLAPEAMIPLSALLLMPHPPTQIVGTYYAESERLVRFLVSLDKARLLRLLQSLSQNESFESAFTKIYAGTFASYSDFEQKFAEFASKDYGSSLQD